MRVNSERPGSSVDTERLRLRLQSTAQQLDYRLLKADLMYDGVNGSRVKVNLWELDRTEITFRDYRELDEFITVLTRFRDQVEAGLGRWENDWRLR